MNEYKAQAIEKINAAKLMGWKEDVVAKPLKAALCEFCRQSDEFAQAICQGGSLEACAKDILKNVGHAISDIDLYSRAVKYYFPTATISFSMAINTEGDTALTGSGDNAKDSKHSALSLSLDDLLDI